MQEITIPKAEYDSLLTIKAKSESLEVQVKSLEEETKNKSIAIDEARKKTDEAKKQAKAELDSEKEKNTKILEKLGLTENEDPLVKIDELSTKAQKFGEFEDKQKQERTTRIDEYKKTLGEDFLKTKSSLLDGLPDDKQELILKDFVDSTQAGKRQPPKVGIHTDGTPPAGGTTDFEKLVSTGTASVSDLIGAMD